MKTTSHLISAAVTMALGILFVILKAEVVGICITLLGIALIVTAVLDLVLVPSAVLWILRKVK